MNDIKISASFKLTGRTKLGSFYKDCIQTINMGMEAYKFMIGTPTNSTPKHWWKMSENQRIAKHLEDIKNDLRAKSFEFTVFND